MERAAVCARCAGVDRSGQRIRRVDEPGKGVGILLSVGLVLVGSVVGLAVWVQHARDTWSKQAVPEQVTERRGPAGQVPLGLERFYAQELSWGDCSGYGRGQDGAGWLTAPDARCARLTVPLDYARPQGDTITLPLLRRSAEDQGSRIGSLLVNPGGPGESGLAAAARVKDVARNVEMVKRFDFVGFEPRGVGAAEPAVHCFTDAERDAQRAGKPDDAAAAAQSRAFGDKCAQGTDNGAAMLGHIGTADVARDMDVLRSALGDEQLSFLGYSYGTSLGTTYAALFPRNVRAMVLDGAVDPMKAGPIDAPSLEAVDTEDMPDGFDKFAQWCASRQDCALGTDASRAAAEFERLASPLKKQPAQAGIGRKLSYRDAKIAVLRATSGQYLWEKLNQGLAELRQGATSTTLLSLADEIHGRSPESSYSNESDARAAINCADYGCRSWPVPAAGLPKVPDQAWLPAILVVSTTGDPVTPLRNAESLARVLHGRLLTVEKNQHGAFLMGQNGNECVDRAGSAYLVDLTLPELTLC